jgi:hypothetical protein
MKLMTSIVALFGITLTFAAMAKASANVTLDVYATTDLSIDSVQYELNPELGRARVDVELYSEKLFSAEDSSAYYEADYTVTGLAYDTRAAQVMFTGRDGSRTVCANVTEKHTLFGDKLVAVPTGNCSVKVVEATQTNDDGFEQTKEQVDRLIFCAGN